MRHGGKRRVKENERKNIWKNNSKRFPRLTKDDGYEKLYEPEGAYTQTKNKQKNLLPKLRIIRFLKN